MSESESTSESESESAVKASEREREIQKRDALPLLRLIRIFATPFPVSIFLIRRVVIVIIITFFSVFDRPNKQTKPTQ